MPHTEANPFDHAFEMLGHTPDVATDSINAEALEHLTQSLTSRAGDRGRMVLLRSPRAGFGKTHLLTRLYQRVAHTHEFIALEPSKGRYLDASEVLDAVLRRFSRVLPAGGGLTVLDLLARRILAMALEPLVRSGEVPSQDRESALQALQMRPVETFDFHNEDAVTARWAMANFALLGPRLTAELAERTESGFRPVAWWVELLFRYSSAPLDQTTRNSSLFETVFGAGNVETDMHEKLVTLLNLTGLVTSPVLVLDEVEGFSSNPEAALQVATFLNALHQSCNRMALIISVNGDVWETAFLPRLPCGLKDRLSDIVIDLRPMTIEQASDLLEGRAGEDAQKVLEALDLNTGVIYARGLIREASKAWMKLGLGIAPTANQPVGNATAPISLATSPQGETPVVAEPVAPVAPDPVEEPVAAPVEPEATFRDADDIISDAAAEVSDAEIMEDDVFGALNHPGSQSSTQPLAAGAPESNTYEAADGLGYYEDLSAEGGEQASPFAPAQDAVFQAGQVSPFAPTAELAKEMASPFTPAESNIDSPFAIDTGAAPVSPFQIAEPEDQARPFTQAAQEQAGDVPQPHTVTSEDQEKVEDLLRQFRDRYGRDE